MKLSEAILLGSIGSEQGFGPKSGFPNSLKKCAVGAAHFANGTQIVLAPISDLSDIWPWVLNRIEPSVEIVIDGVHNRLIRDTIWLLNDRCKWPRPKIAAWVAKLEKVYDPEPTTTEVSDEAVRSDLVGKY